MRRAFPWLLGLTLACACRDPASRVIEQPPPTGRPEEVARVSPVGSVAGTPDDELVEGREVSVHATHPSGVPLHPEPESSRVSGRLADGSRVRIEGVRDGRWYEVSQGDLRGFLTRRYLTLPREAPKRVANGSPFASPEACQRALAEKDRPRRAGGARIGSWNLHWFPDGKPGREPSTEGTDVAWLSCAIAWLELDVLAVQELKGTARAKAALVELRRALDRDTGGSWQVLVDDCPEQSGQHVGVLYDEKRVRRLASATLSHFNPHGAPCQDQLRPGLDAYLRFAGGLDLHVVSVHLKAGGKARDIGLRRRSFESFSEGFAAAQVTARDADLLVLGDLNTMGCPDCSPPVSSTAEIAALEPLLESEGFRRLPSDLACSFHFSGRGSLLDGASASRGFSEASGAEVRVAGLCAELGCERVVERHPARERLSDHCPLYVDLPDRDDD